jgi:hypothetical protein
MKTKPSHRAKAEAKQKTVLAEANGAARVNHADEAMAVAQRAAAYCVLHFPTLWTAGIPRRETSAAKWVIPIVVRYPTGDELELGKVSFDGTEFAPLTPREEMVRLAQGLEQDPAFQRRWHEQFPSAAHPRTT